MVSESINNSLLHQLAEQLQQQQNLEQFQKQLMEHQQKVGPLVYAPPPSHGGPP